MRNLYDGFNHSTTNGNAAWFCFTRVWSLIMFTMLLLAATPSATGKRSIHLCRVSHVKLCWLYSNENQAFGRVSKKTH